MDQTEGTHSYDRLNNAEDAVLRAKELSQQMLTFSGGAVLQAKITDTAILIQDIGALATRGSSLQIDFSLEDDLFVVSVDDEIVRLILGDLFLSLRVPPEWWQYSGPCRKCYRRFPRIKRPSSGYYLKIELSAPGLLSRPMTSRIFSAAEPNRHLRSTSRLPLLW